MNLFSFDVKHLIVDNAYLVTMAISVALDKTGKEITGTILDKVKILKDPCDWTNGFQSVDRSKQVIEILVLTLARFKMGGWFYIILI